MNESPDQLAKEFLRNYIDAPEEELINLEISQGLAGLIAGVVLETVKVMRQETERTLH